MPKRVALLWLLLALISAFALFAPQKQATLRVGVLKSIDTAHPKVAGSMGYWAYENITVEIREFGQSTALAEALYAGELDAAYMSAIPVAIWHEGGADFKVAALASVGGDYLVVRSNTTPKTVAVSQPGTFTQILYRGYAKGKFPLQEVSGIEPADMPTALLDSKQVDAIFVWEPYASRAEEFGGAELLDAGAEWKKDFGKPYPRNLLVVSAKLAKDSALLAKLLSVHRRTVDFMNTGEGKRKAAEVYGTKFNPAHASYSYELDWDNLARVWNLAKEVGYLKKIPEKGEILVGG